MAALAQSTRHWCTTRPRPAGLEKRRTRTTSRLVEQPREPSTSRTVPDTFLVTVSSSGQSIVLDLRVMLAPASPVAEIQHSQHYNKHTTNIVLSS